MRRAVLLFGGLIACWSDRTSGTTTVENTQPIEQPRDLTGAYWCTIESSGYTYDPYPCVIRRIEHDFVLAKLGGSQRFTGVVRPVHGGFSFEGEFYCPWGDCTQRMHGMFRPGNGGFEFQDDHIAVHLRPAPESAFGGVSYGGDGYGGFGQWGGAGYGGAPEDHPNRGGVRNPRP